MELAPVYTEGQANNETPVRHGTPTSWQPSAERALVAGTEVARWVNISTVR